jgi:sugar lactone lactonase YvrE
MTRATRVLSDRLTFGEGPRWRDGRLWFSDFYSHEVQSISLEGDLRTEFAIDDQPSGLGWMPNGDLLVVSMERRQVLRRTPKGSISVHADLSKLATFHCNDMVVDATGRAYVGNFGFDLNGEIASRGFPSVIEKHGTAKLICVEPDGRVSEAASEMHFPNGTVITPDGKTLIVGETLGGCLTAFDIDKAGKLSNRRQWASLWPRVPDGICLDAEGAIWIANPAAPECARIAEGGKVLEVITTSAPCFACMLGGADGRALFMLTSVAPAPGAASQVPRGNVEVTTVDIPHAGLP